MAQAALTQRMTVDTGCNSQVIREFFSIARMSIDFSIPKTEMMLYNFVEAYAIKFMIGQQYLFLKYS